MKLNAFKFNLPKEQIALYPTKDRDGSKLMVLHKKDGKIEHKKFKDILDYFDEGDTFILNNTRVFPARMWGNKEKTGAKIEVFLLRELNRDSLLWDVIVDPARKIRIGNKLYFGKDDELVAEVIDNTTSRGRSVSTRAMFTRCFWPPESSAGRCLLRFERPTRSSAWSARSRLFFAPA